MNQFLKISQEQFDKDFEGKARYSDIKLPTFFRPLPLLWNRDSR